MVGEQSFQGPHVRASREGTADAGGGTLQVIDGRVMVQGAVRGRLLGEVMELHKLSFGDHRGRSLTLHFFEATWELQTEEGDLMAFAELVQARLGRGDMITLPPSPGEQLRAEITPERGRLAALCALAVLGAVGLYFAVAAVPQLGYGLLVLLAPYLVALGASRLLEGGPRWLGALRDFAAARGWLTAWLVPALALLAACLGVVEAGHRAAEAEAAAEAKAAAEAQAAAEAKAAEEAAQRQAQALATLLAEVQNAAGQGSMQEAQALLAQADGMAPGAPAVAAVREKLAPQLAQAGEVRREEAVREALRLGRAVVADPLRCEAAKAVSDVWAGLRLVQPGDPNFEAVQKLVAPLELCRKRVVRAFSQGAVDARVRGRGQLASDFEAELRRGGHPGTVELLGKHDTRLRISLDLLDGEVAAAVVGHAGEGGTLLQRAEAAGFAVVELRDRAKRERNYRLQPAPETGLAQEALAGFGLDAPLSLGAPAE